MPSAADIKPLAAVQAVVVSQPKEGKTEGAATFPRPVFLDFDNGMRVIRNPEFRQRHPEVDISLVRFDTFIDTDLDKFGVIVKAQAFDRAMAFAHALSQPSPSPWTCFDGSVMDVGLETYDTIVCDSLTSLLAVATNKTIIMTGKESVVGMRNKTDTHAEAQKHGFISLEGSDYAGAQNTVLQLIDKLRSIPGKNVLFLAHEEIQKNKKGETTGYDLLMTGKAVSQIKARFDEIWFLTAEVDGFVPNSNPPIAKFKRIITTHKSTTRPAGTRLGVPDGTPWTYRDIASAVAKTQEK